jgi:NACalpha-BTF3-like transcription factor
MESSSNDACILSVDTNIQSATSNADDSENCDNCENREKFDNSENKIISISEDISTINDNNKDADGIPKTRQELINEYYKNLQKQKYERFIEITMNQTTYTREEAIASLEKHKGDITLVIKEFLGVKDNRDEIEKQKNSKSLNQKRYSIIRECMDNAARNFAKKQQQAKMYSEFIEKQKRLQEEKQEKQDRQDKEI